MKYFLLCYFIFLTAIGQGQVLLKRDSSLVLTHPEP
jgi:hypothetical protein